MPTPTNGLVQVTMKGTFLGQTSDNVFYYWDSTNSPIGDMQGIANAFDALVFPEWSAITAATYFYSEIVVRDVLGLNNDFTRAPSVGTGTRAGDEAPSWASARVRLNVTNKETRTGFKRLGGLVEAVKDGNFLLPAFITDVQTFADLLDNSLVVGAQTYAPVVYGQGTKADPTRQVVNPIISALALSDVGPQNSRRPAS